MSPSKSVAVNKPKLIKQEIPRLATAAQNLFRYGLTRTEILAAVRDALNDID